MNKVLSSQPEKRVTLLLYVPQGVRLSPTKRLDALWIKVPDQCPSSYLTEEATGKSFLKSEFSALYFCCLDSCRKQLVSLLV